MAGLIRLSRRAAFWLRARRHAADLADEIEQHRARTQAALEAAGLTPAEAAARSRKAMGNMTLAREDAREVWTSGGRGSAVARFEVRDPRPAPRARLRAHRLPDPRDGDGRGDDRLQRGRRRALEAAALSGSGSTGRRLSESAGTPRRRRADRRRGFAGLAGAEPRLCRSRRARRHQAEPAAPGLRGVHRGHADHRQLLHPPRPAGACRTLARGRRRARHPRRAC